MPQDNDHSFSRRRFLKTAGATALAAGTGPAIIVSGRAQPKTLKILKWNSFIAGFDEWFENHAKNWGEENNTQVIVDSVGFDDATAAINAEFAAKKGHDLIWPPAEYNAIYEDQTIDHSDIYAECERRYGKPHPLAIKTTLNPMTGKHYAFCVSYGPSVVNYRKDLWGAVGMVPDTWEAVWRGGRRIKLLHNRPVGIGLAPQVDSEGSTRAILYSFGASVQNTDNQPILKSKATLEALKFVKMLFAEAMMDEVLSWDPASNNRAMLAGEISLALNPISITRTGENKQIPGHENIWLAPPPQGPSDRLFPVGAATNFIWRFAENIAGASQFLVDFIGQTRQFILARKLGVSPAFPETIPDLEQLLANDEAAIPPGKYKILASSTDWSTNFGHPGGFNVAIAEIFSLGLIPKMFANAASGKMTPDEAMNQADQEVRKIYDKWRALGKV